MTKNYPENFFFRCWRKNLSNKEMLQRCWEKNYSNREMLLISRQKLPKQDNVAQILTWYKTTQARKWWCSDADTHLLKQGNVVQTLTQKQLKQGDDAKLLRKNSNMEMLLRCLQKLLKQEMLLRCWHKNYPKQVNVAQLLKR